MCELAEPWIIKFVRQWVEDIEITTKLVDHPFLTDNLLTNRELTSIFIRTFYFGLWFLWIGIQCLRVQSQFLVLLHAEAIEGDLVPVLRDVGLLFIKNFEYERVACLILTVTKCERN